MAENHAQYLSQATHQAQIQIVAGMELHQILALFDQCNQLFIGQLNEIICLTFLFFLLLLGS